MTTKAYQVLKKIWQHRETNIRDTAWTREVSPLLLCHSGKHDHKLQSSCSNLQEECCKTFTETSIHTTKDPTIQNKDTRQVWMGPIHSRLVVMIE